MQTVLTDGLKQGSRSNQQLSKRHSRQFLICPIFLTICILYNIFMKWASAVSEHSELETGIAEAAHTIRKRFGDSRADLLVVFVSSHHYRQYDQVPSIAMKYFPEALLIGCSAGAVIGDGHEIEGRPAVSLTAAYLPDVQLMPIRVESALLPSSEACVQEWEELIHVPATHQPDFLLLPDPYTFDAERLLAGLDKAYPSSHKVGGLVSGAGAGKANALFLGHRVHYSGAIGLALTGNIAIDTLVSQGCRPIGAPMFVTRYHGNAIDELDGRSPLLVLKDLYKQLRPSERHLFSDALFLGVVMDRNKQVYGGGDFLIRNIAGIDSDTGSLIVAAHLTDQEIVQFHVRDAQSSTEDLDVVLKRYCHHEETLQAEGTLLFSCIGRGERFFGCTDHDTDMVRRYLGTVPVGGFFCNGEIGQVKGETFLHGFTSSFGIFKRRH